MVAIESGRGRPETRIGPRGPLSPERAPEAPSRDRLYGYHWVPNVGRGVGTRGFVTGWTEASRFRLMKAAARIEWPRRPLALITLTYPRHFSADPDDWKEHLRRFSIAWARRFGEPLLALWAMEFQQRGAPHFHLAAVLPSRVALDDVTDPRTRLVEKGLRTWIAETWYELAGHGDIRHLHQHLKAEHTKLADGPRGLAEYLRRELGKGRQKTLPDWLADEEHPKGAGRWWGRFGLQYADVTAELTAGEYQMCRRLIRRLLRQRGVRRRGMAHRHECLTLFDRSRRRAWRLADEIWHRLKLYRLRAVEHFNVPRPAVARSSFAELERSIVARVRPVDLWPRDVMRAVEVA